MSSPREWKWALTNRSRPSAVGSQDGTELHGQIFFQFQGSKQYFPEWSYNVFSHEHVSTRGDDSFICF